MDEPNWVQSDIADKHVLSNSLADSKNTDTADCNLDCIDDMHSKMIDHMVGFERGQLIEMPIVVVGVVGIEHMLLLLMDRRVGFVKGEQWRIVMPLAVGTERRNPWRFRFLRSIHLLLCLYIMLWYIGFSHNWILFSPFWAFLFMFFYFYKLKSGTYHLLQQIKNNNNPSGSDVHRLIRFNFIYY